MLDVAGGQRLPQADGFCCFTHDTAVHDHISAARKVLRGELMFRGYVRSQRVALARKFDLLVLFQVGERNQDVVPGIELQNPVGHLFYCKAGISPAFWRKLQAPKSLRIPAQDCLLRLRRKMAEVMLHRPMARPYEAATVHTGQSEPIIRRSGPKASKATSR